MKKYVILGIILICSVFVFAWRLTSGQDAKSIQGKETLDAFDSVFIDVIGADVLFVKGNEYAIDYHLSSREMIDIVKVSDGELYFETAVSRKWKKDFDDWKIIVTVPEETTFENVKISSTAGKIIMDDFFIEEGEFETTAGKIELSHIQGDSLTVKSVSHPIKLEDCAIKEEIVCETTAGHIYVNGQFGSIHAKSIGGIIYNDIKQGRLFETRGKEPRVELKSVSGKIEIHNKEIE